MLNDGGVDMKYWGEAVNTANYIQNRMLSSAVDVTPYELWFNKTPSLKHVRVFGSTAYAHITMQKRRKLDNVAVKCTLVGYCDESKFIVFNSSNVGGDVVNCEESNNMVNIFMSNVSHSEEQHQQNQQMLEDLESSMSQDCYGFESAEEYNLSSSENEGAASVIEVQSCDNDQLIERRVSTRNNKGNPPKRYGLKITTEGDPKTYKEAMSRPDSEKWLFAMKDEIKSMYDNHTWELVQMPEGKKLVGCKWVYKIKKTVDGNHKYKARLVAQGFSQKYGEDYDQVFAPVVKQTTLRTLLAM